MVGDKNMRNPVLYPPILTTIMLGDTSLQFTEDILLQIQKENNLEEILEYFLLGYDLAGGALLSSVLIPAKLTKNLIVDNFIPDYENYYYAIPESGNKNNPTKIYLEISKLFPYLIELKSYETE